MPDAVIQLSENIFLIAGEDRAQFPYCNTLVVKDREILLVDPGAGTKRLHASLNQLGIRLRDIDFLLLSHYHYDHRGPAVDIQLASECEILVHPADAPAVKDYVTFKKYTGILDSPFEADWDHFFKSLLNLEVCPVSSLIQEGDRLNLGATEWEILHTPGHTPGHVSLFESDSRILFTADVDLTRFGPWYGNIASDLTDFRNSVQRLHDLVTTPNTDPLTVTTGHRFRSVNNPAQAFNTYANHFEIRDHDILTALKGPRTLEQLIECNIIHSDFSIPILRFFEGIMIEKHLASLQAQGRIMENPEGTWHCQDNKNS